MEHEELFCYLTYSTYQTLEDFLLWVFLFVFVLCAVLGTEHKALNILVKHFTELYP